MEKKSVLTDVIHTSDYIAPLLAVGCHVYWIGTKRAAIERSIADGAAPLAMPWQEPALMSAAYLAAVISMYMYMNRPSVSPARCRAAMIVHNLYLTALSLVMAVVLFSQSLAVVDVNWLDPAEVFSSRTAAAVFGQRLPSPPSPLAAWILWVNYNSKFVEFGDTFFMLARKRFGQVSFLHTEHHFVMGPIMWLMTTRSPGGPSLFGPMLNSIVHVFMYAFYACQATKTPFPLPKQFVTILQMVQFVVIGCHAGWNLAHPNVAWPVLIAWTEFWLIINMLVLFGNFFYQSYVAVKKKGGAKDE